MEQELIWSFILTFAAALIVVGIVILLLFTVAEWRILTKAGEKGWKSLIPFYSLFISHHIVGMSHVWFILEVFTWITEVVLELVEGIPQWAVIAFGIPTLIITVVSGLIHMIKLCRCFGKGTGFTIGMILLPSLFTLILAFGKAEYQQPEHKATDHS